MAKAKAAEPLTLDRALTLAADLLHALGEAENLYADYKADEGFTDEQFDQMIEMLRGLKTVRVIAYAEGGVVQGARASHPNVNFSVCDGDELEEDDVEEGSTFAGCKETHQALSDEYDALPEAIY